MSSKRQCLSHVNDSTKQSHSQSQKQHQKQNIKQNSTSLWFLSHVFVMTMGKFISPQEWWTCLLVCKPKLWNFSIRHGSLTIAGQPLKLTMTWMIQQNKDYEASYLAFYDPTSPRLLQILQENKATVYEMTKNTPLIDPFNRLNHITTSTRAAIAHLAIAFRYRALFQTILAQFDQANVTQAQHAYWMKLAFQYDDVDCFKLLQQHRKSLISKKQLPYVNNANVPLTITSLNYAWVYMPCQHQFNKDGNLIIQNTTCDHNHINLLTIACQENAINILTFLHQEGFILENITNISPRNQFLIIDTVQSAIEFTIRGDYLYSFTWWIQFYPNFFRNVHHVLYLFGSMTILQVAFDAKLHCQHQSWIKNHLNDNEFDIYRQSILYGTPTRERFNMFLKIGYSIDKNRPYFQWIIQELRFDHKIMAFKVDVLDWFLEQGIIFNHWTCFSHLNEERYIHLHNWVRKQKSTQESGSKNINL
jgi:hypothetical protein